MITKRIARPRDISNDSIIKIIELYFAGSYKTTRVTNSRIDIRKLYKYNVGHSREVAHKKMNFKDSGYFELHDDYITFNMTFGKQILFYLAIWIFGTFIVWKVWSVSFLISITMVFAPILFIWLVGISELKDFMKIVLVALTRQMNDLK